MEVKSAIAMIGFAFCLFTFAFPIRAPDRRIGDGY